jgi:hypothetical protein
VPRIPETPLPRDVITQSVLEREVDAWWNALTLGQKLAVAQPYVEANVVEAKAREQHGDDDIIDGEVVDTLPAKRVHSD